MAVNVNGYEETKRALRRAAGFIDLGSYRAADHAIRHSGATRADLDNVLGKSRLAKMRKWQRTASAHGVGP